MSRIIFGIHESPYAPFETALHFGHPGCAGMKLQLFHLMCPNGRLHNSKLYRIRVSVTSACGCGIVMRATRNRIMIAGRCRSCSLVEMCGNIMCVFVMAIKHRILVCPFMYSSSRVNFSDNVDNPTRNYTTTLTTMTPHAHTYKQTRTKFPHMQHTNTHTHCNADSLLLGVTHISRLFWTRQPPA